MKTSAQILRKKQGESIPSLNTDAQGRPPLRGSFPRSPVTADVSP